MKTVAVDAMGGDRAPRIEVEGAVAAARTGQVRVLLVGQRERIERELRRLSIDGQGRSLSWRGGRSLPLEIHHASEVIAMDEAPALVVRRKRDASMRVATELLAAGAADAVVSAGNSGAMVACGLFVLGRLPGVDRPGILATLPTARSDLVLLDTGANVECRPLHLLQYAVMGACYARRVLGRQRPRVGLLSNGSERHKGTELTREADRHLRTAASDGWRYLGYVEGPDLFAGGVDVAISDGFSGNLVLKVSEGAADVVAGLTWRELRRSPWALAPALLLLPIYGRLRRRIDYAEQGGALLLGVRGTAMICHGRSNAKAICNAVLHGARHACDDLASAVGRSVAAHAELFAAARAGAHAVSGNGPDSTGGARPAGELRGGAPAVVGGAGAGREEHDETREDSRSGAGGGREGADQRRPGADGRHQRRVDHRAYRDQGAARPR